MAKAPPKKQPDEKPADQPDTVELPCRGDVTIETSDSPPPTRRERIHPRRPAPPVPEKRTPEGD